MADQTVRVDVSTVAAVWRAGGAGATADYIDALAAEVRRLRAEVSLLDQVCRDQRERVPWDFRDHESGIYVGGSACMHPRMLMDSDRCRFCGFTGAWEDDSG